MLRKVDGAAPSATYPINTLIQTLVVLVHVKFGAVHVDGSQSAQYEIPRSVLHLDFAGLNVRGRRLVGGIASFLVGKLVTLTSKMVNAMLALGEVVWALTFTHLILRSGLDRRCLPTAAHMSLCFIGKKPF